MPFAIVGVDPGLVDTGIVAITFYSKARQWAINTGVVRRQNPLDKIDLDEIERVARNLAMRTSRSKIFVEEYRPRLKLQTDKEMLEMQSLLRKKLDYAVFLPNMGIKQLITSDFMKMLHVWNFPQSPTHHQDLRSAARIALLGAIKDDEAAEYVNQYARDQLVQPVRHWARIP